jgi:hypothetical protein
MQAAWSERMLGCMGPVIVTKHRVMSGQTTVPLVNIHAASVERGQAQWGWLVAAIVGGLMLLRALEHVLMQGVSAEVLGTVAF